MKLNFCWWHDWYECKTNFVGFAWLSTQSANRTNAALSSLCWCTNEHVVLQCKRQSDQVKNVFAPRNAAPCTLPPGAHAPCPAFLPPLHAYHSSTATIWRRFWLSRIFQNLKRSRDSEHISFGINISCMHSYSSASFSTLYLKCLASSVPKISLQQNWKNGSRDWPRPLFLGGVCHRSLGRDILPACKIWRF